MSDAQRLAADPNRSAFVRANAGSGKTKTLIDRTARLLLAGAQPQTILCVTYTKAAAAEMQRRLFDRLGSWSVMDDERLAGTLADLEGRAAASFSARELSNARVLFAKALETPGGLKIQTIHAFCERLLRRFPLEAGVSPGFEVIEDAAAAAIASAARAEVADLALRGVSEALSDAYRRMSIALDFQSFQTMFSAFEAERTAIGAYVERVGGLNNVVADVWGTCGFSDGPVESDILEGAALAEIDFSVWRAAAGLMNDAGKHARNAQALLDAAAAPSLTSALAALFTAGGEGDPATVFTTSAILRTRPDIQNRLLEDQDALIIAREQVRAAAIAQNTVHVLRLAFAYVEAYEIEKAQARVLDFTDLVARASALVATRPAAAWVLYKLDGGIDHILLDEAQDTAPDQWEILRRLTDEFFSGASRPADRPVERTVFIVGDQKQSIYSFQGADPRRLASETEGYIERIVAAGRIGEEVGLEESWRSTPQVLNFVDAVFRPEALRAAVSPGTSVAVAHTVTRADHTGCVDLWDPEREAPAEEREAWDAPLDAESLLSANRRLADKIAAECAAIVARRDAVFDKDHRAWRAAGYGDILILVRRRGALFEDILRSLKHIDVPVAGADRLALSKHIVFDDLLALARFALYPQDELTLAALLKSPFCGLEDDSLFDLADQRKPRNLWTVLAERRAERPLWAQAFAVLDEARGEARSRRPFDFFGRFLSQADAAGVSMRARVLARMGEEANEAIDEFLAQVLAAEARGLRDLESLAAALVALDITVKREMDAPRGEVRVMTAHGAKGLEAPIVFLPEMTLTAGPRGSPLLRTEKGGFLWCSSQAGDCEASAAARALRVQRDEEERLRLLYVALTRARDRLILCGRVRETAKLETIGGWYGATFDALKGELAGEARPMQAAGQAFLRYGPDPVPAPPSPPPAARETAPAPTWLRTAPAADPVGVRVVSPSGLEGAVRETAASPLARAGGLGRFKRGTLIHRLLQLLPDLPPSEWADGAARLLAREPDLSDDQRAEMAAAALGVLENPLFAPVFGPGSRPEVAVAGRAAGLPQNVSVAGRIDRLVVEAGRVLIVDFKTNRPAPDRIEDADPAYIAQMAAYGAVLAEAFPKKRIEAALVWTDGPKLMSIPENMVTAALARWRDAP